ncbi:MAG: sulfatase-like hydrolase/transferase [Planctomycetota bacterium]|nr:sulfatase-like hydrolase/transferase [Planctomycetota bacterium]
MSKRKNLLILGVDSLWADHMSCYGYARNTTPHIDAFAKQGTLFKRNYSAYIPTTPAYHAMLTGKDPFSTQIVALRNKTKLPEHIPTLPEILRPAGYESLVIGFDGHWPRGFDKNLTYTAWGSWEERPLRKAENLNNVLFPELDRLAKGDKPWFVFLRHMDPHSPYLPPAPFDRLFYTRNEADPNVNTIKPVFDFKPFAEFFKSWMPPGVTDIDWGIAAYDGAVAYMDSCIGQIFNRLDELGLAEDTVVLLNGDHGETLADHDCYFDHHGLYDCTLHVPLIVRAPGKTKPGQVIDGFTLHEDLVPGTLELLELSDLAAKHGFDGKTFGPLLRGERETNYSEFYITECTWMRKHGWRTPQWKLIRALEPDFHGKPAVELYDLIADPNEDVNLAEKEPGIVKALTERMHAYIERRKKESGQGNPIDLYELGLEMKIGSVAKAKALQEKK